MCYGCSVIKALNFTEGTQSWLPLEYTASHTLALFLSFSLSRTLSLSFSHTQAGLLNFFTSEYPHFDDKVAKQREAERK